MLFLFQLQIPTTVMFSCLFEMLLYMVTDECSSMSFIIDPSSRSLGIKLGLGKAWPLGASMQFSTAEKLYKTP